MVEEKKPNKYALLFQKWLLEGEMFGIRGHVFRDDYFELKERLQNNPRYMINGKFDEVIFEKLENKKFKDYLSYRLEEMKNQRISDAKSRIEKILAVKATEIAEKEKDLNTL